jgi:membrane protein DedA with SNARE-associated domain
MQDYVLLLTHYLSTYGYVALYFIVFIGGTYLPLPGGLFVIATGTLARAGYLNIYVSFAVALLAGVTGDLLPFIIARKFEKQSFFRKYIEKHSYAKNIQEYMRTYPRSTIFLSRFIGFISMPVNILAGLSKIHTRTFLLMDISANFISTLIYMSVGYIAGAAILHGTNIVTILSIILGGMAVFYGITFFVWEKAKSHMVL